MAKGVNQSVCGLHGIYIANNWLMGVWTGEDRVVLDLPSGSPRQHRDKHFITMYTV